MKLMPIMKPSRNDKSIGKYFVYLENPPKTKLNHTLLKPMRPMTFAINISTMHIDGETSKKLVNM